MRHIRKGREPAEFIEWKTQGDANWDPDWEAFDGHPVKQVVKQALLDEQGHLCCYCEVRVGLNKDETESQFHKKGPGHIEHIKARHKHGDLELAYHNLVYSCAETDKGQPTTCGHARKPDDPVPVSPLEPDCESRFLYTERGEILPRNEDDFDARETVRILKLNEKLLCEDRARVYQEIIQAHEEDPPDKFRRWMNLELQRDANNMLKPYWGTKRYVIETMLQAW